MRERDKRSDSGSETDAATASSSSAPSSSSRSSFDSSSSESSAREGNSAKRHGRLKRKRSVSTSRVRDDPEPSSSSPVSSETDIKRRKSRSTRGKERRSRSHRRDRAEREKEKKRERKRRSSKGSDEKHGRKEIHRRKDKHYREKRKRNVTDVDSVAAVKDDDVPVVQFGAKSTLQAMNEAQLQQKEIVRRNVEMAKAKLASGELQRMKHEQMEMQRLYGTVDWREKKKLRAEKSRLERTVAAGKKLASIEERENARMDAFRVADCQQPKHSARPSGELKQHEHLRRQKPLIIRIICHHLLVVECPPGLVRSLGHDCHTKRYVDLKHRCILLPEPFPSICHCQLSSSRVICLLQLALGMWLLNGCHSSLSVLPSFLNFTTGSLRNQSYLLFMKSYTCVAIDQLLTKIGQLRPSHSFLFHLLF